MHKNENIDTYLNSLNNNNFDNFVDELTYLKQNCRIIKRIPKGARNLVATQFSKLMEKSIKENNFSSWREPLTLPYKLLNVPPKENGKGKNSGKSLVRLIKEKC